MSDNDTAVKDDSAVTQDTTATDSAPVDKQAPEVTDDSSLEDNEATLDELENEVTQEETDSKQSKAEAPEDASAEDTTPENQSQQGEKPLKPKSENRFQKLANENRQLKEQLAQLSTREAQVATEQELMNQVNPETGDYYTPQEAERIARYQANENLKKQLAQERTSLEIQQNQERLVSEASKIVEDFPVLNENSPEYNPAISDEFDRALGDALIFQLPDGRQFSANTLRAAGIDPETQAVPVGSTMSPYQLAKLTASSISVGATQGQVKAQKATQQMLASADTSPNASKATKQKKDPMLEAFDEEAGF